MKKIIYLLLFITSYSFSQVSVGMSSYFGEFSKQNKKADIERFKALKTIFVLPDAYIIKEYDKILSETWKINPYEIITNQEFERNPSKYKLTTNSIAEYKGIQIFTTKSSGMSTDHIFFYIEFYLIDKINIKKKETTYEKTSLAAIQFSLNYSQMRSDNITNSLEAEPKHLYNFNLGYLKNYFQKINNDLEKNVNFNCYGEYINKEKLRELKSKKLVFTDDISRTNVSLSGVKSNINADELLSKYEFKYEVVSIDELNKRILNNEEFYYFTYSQINAKKIITITNAKTGEVIYNYMNRMSFNIKEKDFNQVSKEIEKS